MGRKLGALFPFWGGGAGFLSNTMSLGPRPTSDIQWLLDPSSHLTTTDMGRKLGLCPFAKEKLGPHLTQYGQGRGYLHAKFHLDPFNRLATIHQRHRELYRQTDIQTTV